MPSITGPSADLGKSVLDAEPWQSAAQSVARLKWWADGHSIRICDATTGHVVVSVAYCVGPSRAARLAHSANCHAELVAALADFVRLAENARHPKAQSNTSFVDTRDLYAFTAAAKN